MDGLLNFSLAFVFVAFAVVVLLGKADWLMGKYRLTFKGGRLGCVKYRSYNARRARLPFALILLAVALFLVLEYVLRPLPEWSALLLLAVALPIALYLELRCREK